MTIAEKRDAHGLHWRYDHPAKGEPPETWKMAEGVACTVAEFEARATGKSHFVARGARRLSYRQ